MNAAARSVLMRLMRWLGWNLFQRLSVQRFCFFTFPDRLCMVAASGGIPRTV